VCDSEARLRKHRKRLLFICENLQELEALIPIADEIQKLSRGHILCEFTSQDAFYHQGVDDALQEAGVVVRSLPYPVCLPKPFAFNSWGQRLRALLATNRHIGPVMRHYDGLVCGVDSAPARMLIASAHRLGKPTFQVIVSLYLDNDTKRSLKDHCLSSIKHLLKVGLARLTGTDFLALPTRVAGSGCDRIFVMGERVRRALVQNGVPESRVLAYGVPRFARLFELGEASNFPHHLLGNINILYVPGAFASHGMSKQHRLQQQQLRDIVEYLLQDSSGRYRLTVKLHPREREKDYSWLGKYEKLVRTIPPNANIYKAILNSYVVVTICSTVSYEAVLLNRPVIIGRFPNPKALTFKPLVDDFQVADSVQELIRFVSALSLNKGVFTKVVKTELQSVQEVIAPRTPESATLIARQICADMGVVRV